MWKYNSFAKPLIKIYDSIVVKFVSPWVWKCNSKFHLKNYQNNIRDNHLDIGPGSSYYLKNSPYKNLFLVDINDITLNPEEIKFKKSFQLNLLKDQIDKKYTFDSIGCNHVIHCMPGSIEDKVDHLLMNLKPNMTDNCTFFGSTVLSFIPLERHTISGIYLLSVLNAFNVFDNDEDQPEEFELVLKKHFKTVNVELIGSEMLFSCQYPI